MKRMSVLVDDHRPSPPIMTLVTAALISSDDFVNVAALVDVSMGCCSGIFLNPPLQRAQLLEGLLTCTPYG